MKRLDTKAVCCVRYSEPFLNRVREKLRSLEGNIINVITMQTKNKKKTLHSREDINKLKGGSLYRPQAQKTRKLHMNAKGKSSGR